MSIIIIIIILSKVDSDRYQVVLEGSTGPELGFFSFLQEKFVDLVTTVLKGHSGLDTRQDPLSPHLHLWNCVCSVLC